MQMSLRVARQPTPATLQTGVSFSRYFCPYFCSVPPWSEFITLRKGLPFVRDSILPQILPICELNRECCCFRIRSFGNFRTFHRSAILRSKMSKDYEDEYEVRRLKFHRRKIPELYDGGRRKFPKSRKRP